MKAQVYNVWVGEDEWALREFNCLMTMSKLTERLVWKTSQKLKDLIDNIDSLSPSLILGQNLGTVLNFSL